MDPEYNSHHQQSANGQASTSDLAQLSPAPANEDNHDTVMTESTDDSFEFCLAKCRTSSSSVKHENSYPDPRYKHCHGRKLNHVKDAKETSSSSNDNNGKGNDLQVVTNSPE